MRQHELLAINKENKFSIYFARVKITYHINHQQHQVLMATFPGNPSMAQRISRALPSLSRAHQQVAEYVLAHPLQVATMPIDELAVAVGVSLATANRFARALEFEGYAQFRAALVLGFEATLAPVEKLRSKLERPASVADVFDSALTDMTRNLEATRQALDPISCQQAVHAILTAQRIYIIGFGSSSWLGGLLQMVLLGSAVLPGQRVRVLTGPGALTRARARAADYVHHASAADPGTCTRRTGLRPRRATAALWRRSWFDSCTHSDRSPGCRRRTCWRWWRVRARRGRTCGRACP